MHWYHRWEPDEAMSLVCCARYQACCNILTLWHGDKNTPVSDGLLQFNLWIEALVLCKCCMSDDIQHQHDLLCCYLERTASLFYCVKETELMCDCIIVTFNRMWFELMIVDAC